MATSNKWFSFSNDNGATGITVALLLPILLAFSALVVDGALWLALQRQLQTAADAGAIAAAGECEGSRMGAARWAARRNGVQIGGNDKSQLLLSDPLDKDGNGGECERWDDGYTVEISRPAPLLLVASLLDEPIMVGARAKAKCSCAPNNGYRSGPDKTKVDGKGKSVEGANEGGCTHGKRVCRLVPTSD